MVGRERARDSASAKSRWLEVHRAGAVVHPTLSSCGTVFLLIALTAVPARALTISPIEWVSPLGVIARSDGLRDEDSVEPNTYPTSGTVTAAAGQSWIELRYDVSDSGIRVDFDHVLDSAPGSSVGTNSFARFWFRLDADVRYELEGSFSAADPGGAFMHQYVWLFDQDSGVTRFLSSQRSDGVPNTAFVLGDGGGNLIDEVQGGLRGVLRADNRHFIEFLGGRSSPVGDTPTSSTGYLELRFTELPEPGLAWFALILAVAAGTRAGARVS